MRYSASFCNAVCSTCAVCARIAAVLLAMSRCCASFCVALGGLDRQRGLARDQILLRDGYLGGADDLVAFLLALLGDLGQRGQAVGVEEIARMKCLMSLWSSRVSETDSSSRPLFWMSAPTGVLHRLDEGRALFCNSRGSCGRPKRKAVDEFRLDQFAQFGGVIGAIAERLRGQRNREEWV